MISNESELNLSSKTMLREARVFDIETLWKTSIKIHSLLLQELKRNEPSLGEIARYKVQIAVVEFILREKIHSLDRAAARAFKEVREEITKQFPSLYRKNNYTEEMINSLTKMQLTSSVFDR